MAYAAAAIQALGDPTRRAVFEQLRGGTKAVGEIAAELPVSRPAVSQHLRVLKKAGLVTDRQNGTRRLYRVDEDGLAELRGWERLGDSAPEKQRGYDEGWDYVLARYAAATSS